MTKVFNLILSFIILLFLSTVGVAQKATKDRKSERAKQIYTSPDKFQIRSGKNFKVYSALKPSGSTIVELSVSYDKEGVATIKRREMQGGTAELSLAHVIGIPYNESERAYIIPKEGTWWIIYFDRNGTAVIIPSGSTAPLSCDCSAVGECEYVQGSRTCIARSSNLCQGACSAGGAAHPGGFLVIKASKVVM